MTVSTYFILTLSQALVGLLYDTVVGDPPAWPHPARWVGAWIVRLEAIVRTRFSNLRLAGFFLCVGTILPFALMVALIQGGLWWLDASLFLEEGARFLSRDSIPWCSILGGGLICGVWFSFRSLAVEAARIHSLLLEQDLVGARQALAMIVGRDTEDLTAEEVSRAVIESVAENSVDGGVSPFFFAVLGGPALVTLFKATSTLDSMVGYRDERYGELGTVSARFDDALNYIPARLCLVLYPLAALMTGNCGLTALRMGLRDGRKHPSPNSAIGESLFAGALGIQLGGFSTYRGVPSQKPFLGDALQPIEPRDIQRANRLLQAISLLAGLGVIVVMAAILLRGY
ncbi:MAG: adenosylcobinamide-phosphate synthase CbiB [Planctomycetota bacterium]|jgi:adenosylcobinamide-phosphate synthase